MTRYFVDADGKYIGAFEGCVPEAPTAVEVSGPPANAALQVWDAEAGDWAYEVAALAADKLAAIQAEKVRARDAGFTVNGVLFDSDAEARLAYLELAGKLAAVPGYSTSWKASAGAWVTMDAALYAQVAAAGEAHIAAVFAWQAARNAEVAAALAAEDAATLAAVSTTCG